MGFIYHGSKVKGLKRLETRKSTHGEYVYGTPEKVLALIFSARCGDDLTYDLGHFSDDVTGPWDLVENIPKAFDVMFSNSSSIYTLSDATFKDIKTGFREVVSEEPVDVLKEEYCDNVFDGILEAEKEGLVKIYRYPNKPDCMKKDDSNVLDRYRLYKYRFNKDLSKDKFDRLFYLYPHLLNGINELSKEFGYDYHYKATDLIDIFKERVRRQLLAPDYEQYLESSYISICNSYPELKNELDEIYKNSDTKVRR